MEIVISQKVYCNNIYISFNLTISRPFLYIFIYIPIGEAAPSPMGHRKRPEGGREETKSTVSSSIGASSPSTTSGPSRFGQTQHQGGVGPSRRRVPNSKSTNRPQRSGIC